MNIDQKNKIELNKQLKAYPKNVLKAIVYCLIGISIAPFIPSKQNGPMIFDESYLTSFLWFLMFFAPLIIILVIGISLSHYKLTKDLTLGVSQKVIYKIKKVTIGGVNTSIKSNKNEKLIIEDNIKTGIEINDTVEFEILPKSKIVLNFKKIKQHTTPK